MRALLRIRRGVGWIFVFAGLLHAAQMVFASLYSLRRVAVYVSAETWTRMHFGHFLLLVCSSVLYLTLAFRREGIFYYEALADFLAGLGAFVVLMSIVAVILVQQRTTPWISLIPSAVLVGYGAGLIAGRPLGVLRSKPEDE